MLPVKCCSYIIGEHGDSSVAVWSSVNVAGTMLTDLCPTAGESPDVDAEDWQELHRKVIDSGYEIIRLKGYTNWSIGMMCSRLVDCILQNQVRDRCIRFALLAVESFQLRRF